MRSFWRVAWLVVGLGFLLLLAVLPEEKKTGRFLGVPYDLRWPTPKVWKERFWNPEDQRVLTPHVFGWGWSLNLYALGRRFRAQR